MMRAAIGLLFFVLIVLLLVIPLLLIGFVYPAPRFASFVSLVWARGMLLICGVRLTVEGGSEVEGRKSKVDVDPSTARHVGRTLRGVEDASALFVGNHQSALDIPILIVALRGRVRFMAKSTLFHIPIFGWALWQYGYVPIHRTQPRRTRERLQRLFGELGRKPMSFVLFPEGTRSPDGRLLPIRKGAMKICQRAGLPVVPFCINGSVAVCPRNQLRIHPGPVRLTFCRELPVPEVASMSTAELHDRVRASIAEKLGSGKEDLCTTETASRDPALRSPGASSRPPPGTDATPRSPGEADGTPHPSQGANGGSLFECRDKCEGR